MENNITVMTRIEWKIHLFFYLKDIIIINKNRKVMKYIASQALYLSYDAYVFLKGKKVKEQHYELRIHVHIQCLFASDS